jgi:hypothetical protein
MARLRQVPGGCHADHAGSEDDYAHRIGGSATHTTIFSGKNGGTTKTGF